MSNMAGSDEGARLAAVVTDLATSTEALCAIAAALALQSGDRPAAPVVERALADVVAVLGLTDLLSQLERPESEALARVIQARIAQSHELAVDPARQPGTLLLSDVIESQGLTSEALAPVLRAAVVPQLPGLKARLEGSHATFLDARVGAAGLVIAMCRLWPALSCVGIDVSAAAIAFARPRIAEAGLSERIELRMQDVAALEDRDAFDLVWLPASFIGESVLPEALQRLRRATRAGGWIVLTAFGGSDELSVALARLRTARTAGTLLWPAEAEAALVAAGWEDVRSLPRSTLTSLWLTVGRRSGRGQR
jgi:SAM-dependent methyltransferase